MPIQIKTEDKKFFLISFFTIIILLFLINLVYFFSESQLKRKLNQMKKEEIQTTETEKLTPQNIQSALEKQTRTGKRSNSTLLPEAIQKTFEKQKSSTSSSSIAPEEIQESLTKK